MDLALWALNHGVPAAELAGVLKITAEQAQHVYDDIEAKRRTTQYLQRPPVLVERVEEIKY
jgi:NAD+ synthase